MNIELIGDRIAEVRKQHGYTQEQLAQELGVSPQAISKWENGWNLPDIDNMNRLAELFGITMGALLNGSDVDAAFVYRDRLFREEKMFTRLRAVAQTEGFEETYRALSYMRECHEGQLRKRGRHSTEDVLYINHPLMMACHAYYLGVRDDVILASILLHDVVEDTDLIVEKLPFSDDVKIIVDLLSFPKAKAMDKEEVKRGYYERIRNNERACVVKVIDRCNNLSTMAQSFSRKKLIEYVNETETYVIPLLEMIKDYYPKYSGMAFVIKYHMLSLVETVKNMIDPIC